VAGTVGWEELELDGEVLGLEFKIFAKMFMKTKKIFAKMFQEIREISFNFRFSRKSKNAFVFIPSWDCGGRS
jgi:hypothetical protein